MRALKEEADHGPKLRHRMDRSDLESAHRVRQDFARLYQLLRRAHVAAAALDGAEELSHRLWAAPADTCRGFAADVEEAAAHLRQFDERFVSQGRARSLHPTRFRDDAASVVASLSDSHQARRSPSGIESVDRLARQ